MDARFVESLHMIRGAIANIKREMRHAGRKIDIPQSLVSAMCDFDKEIEEALPSGEPKPVKLDLRAHVICEEE